MTSIIVENIYFNNLVNSTWHKITWSKIQNNSLCLGVVQIPQPLVQSDHCWLNLFDDFWLLCCFCFQRVGRLVGQKGRSVDSIGTLHSLIGVELEGRNGVTKFFWLLGINTEVYFYTKRVKNLIFQPKKLECINFCIIITFWACQLPDQEFLAP